MVQVIIKNRRGNVLASVEVNPDTPVAVLKEQLSPQLRCAPNRLRLLISGGEGKRPIALVEEKPISFYPAEALKEVQFKDLGPQISWTTVFIVEYLGPLLFYPLFYLRPSFIYGQGASSLPYHAIQNWAFICWTFHYLKREFETIFVHKFSHETMPILNIFKNSSYYWGAGIAIAYFVNHPLYTPPEGETRTLLAVAAFFFCEICNAITHLQLSNLRPKGTRIRRVPHGIFFNLITCPNYTFEILAWVAFSVLTQTVASYAFALLGAVQMLAWAKGKYIKYVKEFTGENGTEKFPRRRKLLLPFLL